MIDFGRGSNPILPLKIKCSIDEDNFGDCSKTELTVKECNNVAGITCFGEFIITSNNKL